MYVALDIQIQALGTVSKKTVKCAMRGCRGERLNGLSIFAFRGMKVCATRLHREQGALRGICGLAYGLGLKFGIRGSFKSIRKRVDIAVISMKTA